MNTRNKKMRTTFDDSYLDYVLQMSPSTNLMKNEKDIYKYIHKFFDQNNGYKSLNIKSPYDTGKTQMIKTILTVYKPKRILWISYRRTLTMDLMKNFKSLGFEDYQTCDINNADRLIIQLESLIRVNDIHVLKTVEFAQVTKYDLVIIDEVESVLQQFNSPTMKNMSKLIFDYLQILISESKQLITLDGGMDDKTYHYVNSFGKALNVINTAKI